ncbi:MAG: cyclic nucleotide-binding domain-containing protein [Nitrospinae bacterium]|nr:cyclic nucleotide-binding domain-containing protein [Nitrospinota bacterium]
MDEFSNLEEMAAFLEKAPFFHGAPRKALEDLVIDGDIIHIPADEVIIHEGDYEMTCYVTLSGRFKIEVTDKETGKKRQVRIIGAGEIVGEMSVLTGNPRFAEVSCLDEAVALRIHREEFLRFLDASPEIKERIDGDYRKRTLASALRKLNVFSQVDDDSMNALAEKVKLVTRQKNDVIFASGDEADAFYLIRDGFVKMSRPINVDEQSFFDSRFNKASSTLLEKAGPKEFIMAYLGGGSYFGERALFHKRKRVATATAITRLELVMIEKAEFEELMRRHPLVADKLKALAATRYSDESVVRNAASQDVLTWIESHDILGADTMLILDLNQCVRCLHCIETCADLHEGVTRITHNGIRYKNILIPTSCRHCREPTCMIGCPTGAIQRDVNGEVFHTDACIGCGNCAKRCPFGNISIVKALEGSGEMGPRGQLGRWMKRVFGVVDMEPSDGAERRRAVKCDMCKGFEYMGCQHNCPTGAIKTIVPSEFFAKMAVKMGAHD